MRAFQFSDITAGVRVLGQRAGRIDYLRRSISRFQIIPSFSSTEIDPAHQLSDSTDICHMQPQSNTRTETSANQHYATADPYS
jgi:hypothetical protein